MPSESVLVVTVIVALFGLFAAAILWAEKQSAAARRVLQNAEKAKAAVPLPEDRHPKKAA